MLAFFGVGPFELIIIAIIVLVPAAIVAAILVALTRSRSPAENNPNLKPCPDLWSIGVTPGYDLSTLWLSPSRATIAAQQ